MFGCLTSEIRRVGRERNLKAYNNLTKISDPGRRTRHVLEDGAGHKASLPHFTSIPFIDNSIFALSHHAILSHVAPKRSKQKIQLMESI